MDNRIIESAFPLDEMAYSKTKIWDFLTRPAEICFNHLLKLFYFPTFTDYVNGWVTTVANCCARTYKDKSTNKWPEKEFIYNALWRDREDAFRSHLRGIVADFNDKRDPEFEFLPVIFNKKESKAREYMGAYYDWLSEQLSKKGLVTRQEVFSEINKLLSKYAV